MTDKDLLVAADILDKAADELMIRGQHKGRLIETKAMVKVKSPLEPPNVFSDFHSDAFNYDDYEVVNVHGNKVCALGAIGLALGLDENTLEMMGSRLQTEYFESHPCTLLLAKSIIERHSDDMQLNGLRIGYDPQNVIIEGNDTLKLDMAEEMRLCAKELRENE